MNHFVIQFFSTFLIVGGLGFLNFRVADRLYTLELRQYSTSFVVGYSLLWSIVDYIAYLLIYDLIDGFGYSQSITILIAMLFTVVFAFLFTIFFVRGLFRLVTNVYSAVLSSSKHLSKVTFGHTVQLIFDESSNERIYIYDFDHNLIQYGRLDNYSVNSEGVPFLLLSLPEPYNQIEADYDQVMKLASSSESRSFQYIDPINKFIIIIFETNE